MTVVEFGNQNRDTVVLLHGGGLSWWNYRDVANLLAEHYHVVLPVLDGHADSADPFVSIEENAARIIAYIDERLGGQVAAIGGLSLGGQILVEMLSQRPDICRFALIESALVKPMKLTHGLIGPAFGMSYGLIRQKWFAKLQFVYLGLPKALFDDYYRDTCKIQKADMIAFLKANSAYTAKPALSQTKAKVTIAAGSREQKSIRDSAKLLHAAIPNSDLRILKGLRHGDLSLSFPERYAAMVVQGEREAEDSAETEQGRE